jgi:hypothetical protein
MRLIPDFRIGYGDKEIYWLAATIAREPFSFEPFLCGTYGDCGLMMHYDPSQVRLQLSTVDRKRLAGISTVALHAYD